MRTLLFVPLEQALLLPQYVFFASNLPSVALLYAIAFSQCIFESIEQSHSLQIVKRVKSKTEFESKIIALSLFNS